MSISRFALKLIETEWQQLSQIMAQGQQLNEDCECPVLLRYGIACRHYLLQVWLENTPLPKTLLHPRWWLGGGPILQTEWQPFYPTQDPRPLRIERAPTAAEIAGIRQQLNNEERHRYDTQLEHAERQITQISRNLINIGH
jgi:hypothetical protein